MAENRLSRARIRPAIQLGFALALLAFFLVLASLVCPSPGSAAPDQGSTGTAQAASALPYQVYLPAIFRYDATPNLWQAEYYANRHLDGDPVSTHEEVRVDYDWGTGAPAGLPSDYFSIRWTGHWEFDAGEYTFFVYADDGIRLFLDDAPVPIIDEWNPGKGLYQATIDIEAAGLHKLRLEYFENEGEAIIFLRWRRTDVYPLWHGDYYREPWVENGWVFPQDDSAIQFDWGDGCPEGLDLFCDSFSIAWNAEPLLLTGTHRIHVYADDGYQLFVDGNLVADGGWYLGQAGGREDLTYDIYVPGPKTRHIVYNFHDRGGLAEARLWIEDLAHGDWTAEYFNNNGLGGAPVKVKKEESVFVDWGFGKPVSGVLSDNFSVRWSGQRYFHAGCYRFGIFADDGARLWVDGELLIDAWNNGYGGRGEHYSLGTYLTTGDHDVRIEYYELSSEAEIRFWWE